MSNEITLNSYQKSFIQFLLESEVLTFGDFVTKSGRTTPYFINSGMFNSGSRIHTLGKFYAEHIQTIGLSDVQTIFGPAYKGVPLCVATATELYREYQKDTGFTFNRKEAKTHGDKGNLVGYQLQSGDSTVIVEDVITAGTTLREIVPLLRNEYKVEVKGVVMAVDRCEKGTGTKAASKEAEESLGIAIYPIVTIHEIISYLSESNESNFTLSENLKSRIENYLSEYGA